MAAIPSPGCEEGSKDEPDHLTRMTLVNTLRGGLARARVRLHRAWSVLPHVNREFRYDECLLRAQALSFSALLALVPLMAISFSVISLASSGAQAKLQAFLFEHLIPASGSAVTEHIAAFSQRASTVGLVGLVFLILTAVGLFATIEHTFNAIWGVTRRRSPMARFLAFWSIITLGPSLLGVSIYLTASVREMVSVPVFQRTTAYLLPLVLTWAAFTWLYVLAPHTRVRLKPALIAGVAAGSLWEAAKYAFDYYASLAVAVSKIYGSLGILPLFLAWLFLSWVIVLFGAELSYTLQHWSRLSSARRPDSELERRSYPDRRAADAGRGP